MTVAPAMTPLLLIEDDDGIAFVIDYLLRREGFQVERLVDGRQAAERFRAGSPPPLVILDIMLPYHDGFELLAMLRALPDWATVPVLMLSAKSQEKEVVRALEAGANDHVVKPFQPRELVARIQRLLRSAA